MSLFYDLYQSGKIYAAETQASSAKHTAKRAEEEVRDLRQRVDGLTLACQALWEVLRAHTGLTDDAILRKMEEVDLRDGKVDGKIAPKPISCTRCARTTNATRPNCIYCGAPLPPSHVFNQS